MRCTFVAFGVYSYLLHVEIYVYSIFILGIIGIDPPSATCRNRLITGCFLLCRSSSDAKSSRRILIFPHHSQFSIVYFLHYTLYTYTYTYVHAPFTLTFHLSQATNQTTHIPLVGSKVSHVCLGHRNLYGHAQLTSLGTQCAQ